MLKTTQKEIIERLESIFEKRFVSLLLLFCSVGAIIGSLFFTGGGSFFENSDLFQDIDLVKIALAANGISPYSELSHFALYPPLYFYLWSIPYKTFVFAFQNPSNPEVFFAIRALSTILLALSAYLIYRNLRVQGFSKNKAISCGSIFLICSLTALLILVGDSFGLFFLALGCLMFAVRRDIVGLGFVSLAIAFKVHPLVGALLLLVALLSVSKTRFARAAILFSGMMLIFVVIPVLEIPDAWNTFVLLHATDVQTYTFNIFAGSMDFLIDVFPPASTALIKELIDYVWVGFAVSGALALCYVVFRSKTLKYARPLDLLALGGLAWLILLKQTLPHYFLWALIPLLSAGRLRSTFYLLGGELGGVSLFGLAHAFSTGFFSYSINYSQVPSFYSAISFLAGGIVFFVFDLLAMRQLVLDIRNEKAQAIAVEEETPSAARM